ncbi:hypothetical protein AGMMS49992_25320 [Clostridia bacterium]|nr:hypothetical protein AGMMS49992_25320 [Clostridia bacterium]
MGFCDFRTLYPHNLKRTRSYLFLAKRANDGAAIDVNASRIIIMEPDSHIAIRLQPYEMILANADSLAELAAQYGFQADQMIRFSENELRTPGYVFPDDDVPEAIDEETRVLIYHQRLYRPMVSSGVFQEALKLIEDQPRDLRGAFMHAHLNEWADALHIELYNPPADLAMLLHITLYASLDGRGKLPRRIND